ncbi:hypothetical protein RE6C_02897 [Rhodopirellula europaea 6C]|uniref:Uncharacterized protein n=1 Tax=Rhodopirellula europaea 6C TaxID=1263867 RepID=M2AV14_9BACT|nr:hypothetical protein RE6C_02897 [Rhodopirellula europaea 6C]
MRQEELAAANVNGISIMVDRQVTGRAVGLTAMMIVVMMVAVIMCPVSNMDVGPSSMVTLRKRSSVRVGTWLPHREKRNDQ